MTSHHTCSHPFAGLGALSRRVDRMLEELLPSRAGVVSARAAWGPALEVTESPDEIRVTAEVPGLDASGIDVSLEGRTLTIRGEKPAPEAPEGHEVRHSERRHGRFSRIVTLPVEIDREKVAAVTRNGVLTVTLPRRAGARPRRIEIRTD